MAVAESISALPTADKREIRVYRWEAASPKRGVVQIAHGMGEHALRCRPIARALAGAGYDVYANDHRIADPLSGFSVTPESYASMFSFAPRRASVPNILRIRHDLPLFFFVGDRDPVNASLTWFQPLVDRYRKAGLKDVSWRVYGGARHEVLNETNRREVVATLQSWIDRVVARA